MAPPASTYEIDIDFCKEGVRFTRMHDDVTEAMAEYCTQLMHAILADDQPPARHIRKVTLIVRNESDAVIHVIETPEFSCTHQVAAE